MIAKRLISYLLYIPNQKRLGLKLKENHLDCLISQK